MGVSLSTVQSIIQDLESPQNYLHRSDKAENHYMALIITTKWPI